MPTEYILHSVLLSIAQMGIFYESQTLKVLQVIPSFCCLHAITSTPAYLESINKEQPNVFKTYSCWLQISSNFQRCFLTFIYIGKHRGELVQQRATTWNQMGLLLRTQCLQVEIQLALLKCLDSSDQINHRYACCHLDELDSGDPLSSYPQNLTLVSTLEINNIPLRLHVICF